MAVIPRARPASGHTSAVTGVKTVAQVSTSLHHKKQVMRETHRQDDLAQTQFAAGEHPAYVRVGAGLTINLGEFNSLRVDVSITMPCVATLEAVEAAYEETSEVVASYVDRERTKWETGSGG